MALHRPPPPHINQLHANIGEIEPISSSIAAPAGKHGLARLRLRPTKHARRPFLARASRAPPTRRSLVPSRRKPLSETWLNCNDRRGSRRLARLRLRPTRHARRPFVARASRASYTCSSLVPSCRKPRSETWLNCEDRHGSRRLGRSGFGAPACSSASAWVRSCFVGHRRSLATLRSWSWAAT